MDFEWDSGKRLANLRKHGLDFEHAVEVFSGYVVTLPDLRFEYGEQRFKSFGLSGDKVVVIAHTPRKGRTRIISMRPANGKETFHYKERFEAFGRDDGRRH